MDIKTDTAICLCTLAHYLEKQDAFQSICTFLFDFHKQQCQSVFKVLFLPLLYSMDYPTAKPSILVPHETSVKALRIKMPCCSAIKQFINVTVWGVSCTTPQSQGP